MFWSKPIYFKTDGLWFWWEKTHPKVKAVFWDTGPWVDNINGLQLVLSCPPWSDGKAKGQFTSQGGWNGFQLAKAISNPDRHFQPLSCSGPGFVKTKVQMVKTSNSWECQITLPSTQNSREAAIQEGMVDGSVTSISVIATGIGVNFCVASVMCRFLHVLV